MTQLSDIDRRINNVGRSLSPILNLGVIAKRNRKIELDRLSADSLKRIQARYSKPNIHKQVFVIDGALHLVPFIAPTTSHKLTGGVIIK